MEQLKVKNQRLEAEIEKLKAQLQVYQGDSTSNN